MNFNDRVRLLTAQEADKMWGGLSEERRNEIRRDADYRMVNRGLENDPTTKTYIEAPGCLFFNPLEWSLIEMTLAPEKLAEYGQTGYPRTRLEDGGEYSYVPISVNGKSFKAIAASRPILEVK